MNFFQISRQIPEKSDAFCFFNQICENKLESCRKFWNWWELFTIFQNYSLVSLGLGRGASLRRAPGTNSDARSRCTGGDQNRDRRAHRGLTGTGEGRGERPGKCIFEKCIFQKICKILAGSFSVVSKRNFARKYAFDSIFQALQDLHPFAPLQSQNFRKKIGLKNQQFLWKSGTFLQML